MKYFVQFLLILTLIGFNTINRLEAYCCDSANYDYKTNKLVIRKTRKNRTLADIKFEQGQKLRANLLYAPHFCKKNKKDHRCSSKFRRNFIFDSLDVYSPSMSLLRSYKIDEIENSNLANELKFFNKPYDVNLNRVYGDFKKLRSERLKKILNHESFYADDTSAFYINDKNGILKGVTFCLNSDFEYENCHLSNEKREIKLGARAYYGVSPLTRVRNIVDATVVKVLAPPMDLALVPYRLTLGRFECEDAAKDCGKDYFYQLSNYAYNEADLD